MGDWEKSKNSITSISKEELSVIDTLAALHVQRIKSGLTQRELAERIGMSQSQFAKIERLDSGPSLETLNRYASGVGMRVTLNLTPLKPALEG